MTDKVRYLSRDLIKFIEDDGWALVRVSGSHHHYRHPIKPGITTVKHPEKDIPPGTAHIDSPHYGFSENIKRGFPVKRPSFLIAALFVVMTAFTAYAQMKYVAVVETEVDAASGVKINRAEVRLITAALRAEAVKNLPREKYNIMTSETVQSQGSAKLEECADENCVITLGIKIGSDYIVRGIISKIGTNFTISVEMYETVDGNLVESSSPVRTANTTELLDKAAAACAEMYKRFAVAEAQKAAAQAVPPPPPPVAVAPPPSYQPPVPNQTQTPMPAYQPYPPPQPAYQPPVSNQPQTPMPAYQPYPPQPAYQPAAAAPPPAPSYRPPPAAAGAAAPATPSLTTFTDSRDGKRYKTAAIGGKMWMGENLNYQASSGSWCYGNDNSNCGKYGRLYDWKTAKTVCPAGWRLPPRQEWDNLAAAAGGKSAAGKKLKAKSGWRDSGNGTDEYGFSALTGGYRYDDGSFNYAGDFGSWWTATEHGGGNAYYRYMGYDGDIVGEDSDYKSVGLSVRCVQDN